MFSPREHRAVHAFALCASLLFTSACAIDLEQARIAGKTGVEVFSGLTDSFATGQTMLADRQLIGELDEKLTTRPQPSAEALATIHAQLAAQGEVMDALAQAFAAFHALAAFDDATEIGLRFQELRSASDELAKSLQAKPLDAEKVAIVEAGLRLLARWFQASRVAQENERLIVLTTRVYDLLKDHKDTYVRLCDDYYIARKNLIDALAPSNGQQEKPALQLDAALLAEIDRLDLPVDPATLRTYFGNDSMAQETGARAWVKTRLLAANEDEKSLAMARIDASIQAVEKLLKAQHSLAASETIDIEGIVAVMEQVRALRDAESGSETARSNRSDGRAHSGRPRVERPRAPRSEPRPNPPVHEGASR